MFTSAQWYLALVLLMFLLKPAEPLLSDSQGRGNRGSRSNLPPRPPPSRPASRPSSRPSARPSSPPPPRSASLRGDQGAGPSYTLDVSLSSLPSRGTSIPAPAPGFSSRNMSAPPSRAGSLMAQPSFASSTASHETEYNPQLQGANPCRNKHPTPDDHAACQHLCDDTYGISAPMYGGGSWTIGKCKKTKCKCRFNHEGFKRYVTTLERLWHRGNPKTLGNLVIQKYNKQVDSGRILVDESNTLL